MYPEWRMCESLAHAAEIIYDYSDDMKLTNKHDILLQQQNYNTNEIFTSEAQTD